MVSVIIPSYNREKTIGKAAKSVLDQTYSDLELIIVDDGSTDRTKEAVEAIGDPRVRYVPQENGGACVARNHGIDEAKGEYIAFQDSDDVWHSDKLERQMAVFEREPDAGIVCCRTRCVRMDGSSFSSMTDVGDGFLTQARGPFGISTQTLLMKREVTEKVRFDPKVTRYQDLDFMLVAMKKNIPVYCVAQSLVDREIGEDSITNHPERILAMATYFQSKHADLLSKKNSPLARFLAGALTQAAADRKRQKSDYKPYIKKALELNPPVRTRAKIAAIQMGLYGSLK